MKGFDRGQFIDLVAKTDPCPVFCIIDAPAGNAISVIPIGQLLRVRQAIGVSIRENGMRARFNKDINMFQIYTSDFIISRDYFGVATQMGAADKFCSLSRFAVEKNGKNLRIAKMFIEEVIKNIKLPILYRVVTFGGHFHFIEYFKVL